MKERPILFSAPMVRAILDGSKTQTRRVVKPQPDSKEATGACWVEIDGRHQWAWNSGEDQDILPNETQFFCPHGQPGDRLWVKEQTIKVEDHGWIGPVYTESDAGRYALEWGYGQSDDPDYIPPHAIKRRPSIFMKRAMSRITLEITGVRVERLQDISGADCIAEGVTRVRDACHVIKGFGYDASGLCHTSAITPYAQLWESINGPDSWAANPWVWVVEFKRVQP